MSITGWSSFSYKESTIYCGLTQSDAWYTFKHPDGSLPGQTLGSQKFFKNFGDQRIEVVAKKNEKGEWVALSCWSKYIGNGKPLIRKESLLKIIISKALDKLWQKIQKKKKGCLN